MFLGHFGAGFGAIATTRRPSLGTLFMASQFIDLLWPLLLLAGLERVALDPGNTAVTPLHFEHYPWSHSLLMVLVWGALFGAVYYGLRRDLRAAAVLGALVVSHWLLDLLVHAPDLPLLPDGGAMVGFGGWNSLALTLLLELGILGAGVWYYATRTHAENRRGTWYLWSLVGFLLVAYAANLAGPPPDDIAAIGWTGNAQWLLIAWGYAVHRHRTWRNSAAAR